MPATRAEKLILHHLAKTGGTALSRYLSNQFSSEKSWQQTRPDEDLPSKDHLDAYSFVAAHYSPAKISYIDEKWARAIIFRNPVDHIVSAFYHIQSKGSGGTFNVNSRTIGEFLETGSGENFEALFDNPQLRFVIAKPIGCLDSQDFEKGVEILSKIDFVGITEQLGALAASIDNAFGFQKKELTAERVGYGPRHAARMLSHSELRSIMKKTEFDDALFRFVLSNLKTSSPRAETISHGSASRTLQLSALALSPKAEVVKAQLGYTAQVLMRDILLHPPHGGESAAYIIPDVRLDGQTRLEVAFSIPDVNGPNIMFSINILMEYGAEFKIEVVVAPGARVPATAVFPALNGNSKIVLMTRAMGCERANYGAAIFINPILS